MVGFSSLFRQFNVTFASFIAFKYTFECSAEYCALFCNKKKWGNCARLYIYTIKYNYIDQKNASMGCIYWQAMGTRLKLRCDGKLRPCPWAKLSSVTDKISSSERWWEVQAADKNGGCKWELCVLFIVLQTSFFALGEGTKGILSVITETSLFSSTEWNSTLWIILHMKPCVSQWWWYKRLRTLSSRTWVLVDRSI